MSVLIEGRVLSNEILFVFRQVFKSVDRVGGAGGHACATIDTAFRVDVHLGRRLESWLIRLGMNAIRWANLNTERIFDTGIGNYISHDESISTDEMSASALAWNSMEPRTKASVIAVTS